MSAFNIDFCFVAVTAQFTGEESRNQVSSFTQVVSKPKVGFSCSCGQGEKKKKRNLLILLILICFISLHFIEKSEDFTLFYV